jgi:Gliding motility associated protein GldN
MDSHYMVILHFVIGFINQGLASEKVNINDEPSISTIEDIFQFRHFSGSIYKESNVYDRKISDYKTGNAIKEESERIEMNVLDLEHDTWIYLTEKK